MNEAIDIKVIELNKSNGRDYIKLFISKKGNNSDNTTVRYETAVRQFFNKLYGIDSIDFITDEMFTELTQIKAQNYFQNMINSKKYTKSTVANSLRIIKKLFNDIVIDRVKDKNGNFLLESNPLATYTIKSEGESYGSFSQDEMSKILEEVEKDGDLQLYLYYGLMYKCGFRKNECYEIKFKDLYLDKEGIARVKNKCKGNKKEDSECGNKLYNIAKEIKQKDGTLFTFSKNYPNDKLFQKTTFHYNGNVKTRFEKCYCSRIGLTEEECINRMLVIHSIKKASVRAVVENGGTMVEAARQGHHSNVNYVMTYCNDNEKSKTSRFINLESPEKLDNDLSDKLQGLNKEQLIDVIMSLNGVCKEDIMKKLKEME